MQQNKMLAKSKAIIKNPTYHDLGPHQVVSHNQVVGHHFTPSRDVGNSEVREPVSVLQMKEIQT